ncbi:MAG: amidophosphoribosyltransferase [Planctomycetaceae bacterium]
MDELQHECGIAAVYHLDTGPVSDLVPSEGPGATSRFVPRMLLDMQNRGQLAAGFTTWNPSRSQIIDTHKDVGGVAEVFRMNHSEQFKRLMQEYAGRAAIGHVRYATCGPDDRSYAQPFERHHIARSKWFSFVFNGQLANYQNLRSEILETTDFHLTRATDTEILNHLISRKLSDSPGISGIEILRELAEELDGAWNLAFLNANGDMFVSRDPRGIRPLCYAVKDSLFAAASESVALTHLGFEKDAIRNVPPGYALLVDNENGVRLEKYAEAGKPSHCFFEWIYFANAASTFDDAGVYLSRKRLGEQLAQREDVPLDDQTIVVPVPDTAKAAADSMAYKLGVPSQEGLLRNRYIGRTFIEGSDRADKVRMKYTALPEVLEGKRVLLVDDSIVRATTLKELLKLLRKSGRAREIHVRIACPPIIAPCFYGIDMSTVEELFAPGHMDGPEMTKADERRMADAIGADSLRYLPVESLAQCVGLPQDHLCRACVTGEYPTPAGETQYQLALDPKTRGRTYDVR